MCVRETQRSRDWFTLIREEGHSYPMSHPVLRETRTPPSLHHTHTHTLLHSSLFKEKPFPIQREELHIVITLVSSWPSLPRHSLFCLSTSSHLPTRQNADSCLTSRHLCKRGKVKSNVFKNVLSQIRYVFIRVASSKAWQGILCWSLVQLQNKTPDFHFYFLQHLPSTVS